MGSRKHIKKVFKFIFGAFVALIKGHKKYELVWNANLSKRIQ